jgi:CheY-like chemotaxis protein
MEEVSHDLDLYLENLAARATAAELGVPYVPRVRKSAETEDEESEAPDEEYSEQEQEPVAAEAPSASSEVSPNGFEVKAYVHKKLLCVEVQEDVQHAFRKILGKMGYRVLLVTDPERAAERYRESPPDAVVFDADGLGPHGIDSFLDMHAKALEDGGHLTALVLLGPRQHYLVKKLPTDEHVIVLPKPCKMKAIQEAISQLVPVA